MTSPPITDADILEALKERSNGEMTYVVRNHFAMGIRGPKRPELETRTIRARLEKLEKRGLVKRVRSVYVRQICWALTEAGLKEA